MNSFICLRSMRLCSSRCSAPVSLRRQRVSGGRRLGWGARLGLTRPLLQKRACARRSAVKDVAVCTEVLMGVREGWLGGEGGRLQWSEL